MDDYKLESFRSFLDEFSTAYQAAQENKEIINIELWKSASLSFH